MKYSIGIDFGTLSARAVLVNLDTGVEEQTSVFEYPHGVISEFLGDIKLPDNYALQHPQDYLDALSGVIKDVLNLSGVNPSDVVGVGIDFTSCTILPVKEDGMPLCFMEKFKPDKKGIIYLLLCIFNMYLIPLCFYKNWYYWRDVNNSLPLVYDNIIRYFTKICKMLCYR